MPKPSTSSAGPAVVSGSSRAWLLRVPAAGPRALARRLGQYEFRWMQDPHLSRRPVVRSRPGQGRTSRARRCCCIDEQGAGDIIHFARFVRLLKAKGARVVLLVRPEIVQLAAEFAGVDHVFSRPDMPAEFDYHIHLMSIPHVARHRVGQHSGGRSVRERGPGQVAGMGGRIHGSWPESRPGMGRQSEISARQFPLDRVGEVEQPVGCRRCSVLFAAKASQGRRAGEISHAGRRWSISIPN